MVHGLNDGHISTYTDTEFPLRKFETFILIKSSDKQQLKFESTVTAQKMDKTNETNTLFHNRIE